MKFKYILVLMTALAFTSCNNWLDVTPQGEVEGEDLLTNEKGYNAALNGIYYNLTSTTLYGKELSYGMMDVLAQYWDLSSKSKNSYYKQSQFDYEDASAKSRFDAIWSAMYQGITQANYILESLESNRSSIKYSELIEGEAYALRAFMHMELAAMYGPVIEKEGDLDQACISYRTSMLDYHSVLERRGDRMNLFAVKGLLMRLELALLNKPGAYEIADELIQLCKQNELFVLTNREDELYDKNLGEETILGFYKNDLWEVTKEVFGFEKGNQTDNFCINTNQYSIYLNDLYGRAPDGSGTDNRLRFWFGKPSNGGSYYIFSKLEETSYPGTIRLPYYPEIPILRLAEVYYVACETMIGKDNVKALGYLNDVRESRNLARLNGSYGNDEIMEFLMREMRKDFIGEGRMFMIYKRLYKEFYVKQGVIIAPTKDKYIFPIPDDEYEFSPNESPKEEK